MPKVKRQHASYSIEQKKIVVAYATQHGRNAAGRHFEIDKTMVGRWIKASETWTSEINDKNMRVGSGRKAFYPEAEKELYNWVLDQRKKGLAVTFITIRISMNEILDRADMVALYGDLTTEFKATTGWLNAFMKRHNLTRCRRTKISQKLPEQLEEKLEEFYQFFDMAGNFTINTKGEKTVHICGTGNENNRFTVVLTCAADGTRLPPICIFKGKQMPRGEKAPPGVVVWFQESGWMNVELMKRYIDYLNRMRSSNSQSRFPAMMVFDSFRGHLEESVKEKFNQSNIDLAVIPGGLTSKCQPLDVAINKPFKDNLRKEWHFWMSNGGAGYTEAGNLRRAKISDVCEWVKRAWESISDDIIVYSFKKCGISNALDGSEDDAIYEEIDEFLKEIENERKEEELEIVDMDDNDDSE
ncbi:unnamed protein product [Rhizophagus irregularis]|nr:unnamed protein product [Rhizophagus irregularis]CAB4445949.1 unnamed protein product [Rhizophagus irregularis]